MNIISPREGEVTGLSPVENVVRPARGCLQGERHMGGGLVWSQEYRVGSNPTTLIVGLMVKMEIISCF